MDSFTVALVIPASPEAIYKAWLSSKGHAEMTGAPAKCSARPSGVFSAWDGYITGKNVELVPNEKIVQAWRTSEFSTDDPDSRIEVELSAAKTGTKVTLKHSGIPAGQGDGYKSGWDEYYFRPMKAHFGGTS